MIDYPVYYSTDSQIYKFILTKCLRCTYLKAYHIHELIKEYQNG